MSTSIDVKKWKKMKGIWDLCEKANIDPPNEVARFFDDESSDDKKAAASLGSAMSWKEELLKKGILSGPSEFDECQYEYQIQKGDDLVPDDWGDNCGDSCGDYWDPVWIYNIPWGGQMTTPFGTLLIRKNERCKVVDGNSKEVTCTLVGFMSEKDTALADYGVIRVEGSSDLRRVWLENLVSVGDNDLQ